MFNTYELIRSKRRSVSLTITKEAKLIVRAPLTLSKKTIDEIVQKKEAWIIKNKELIKKRMEQAKIIKENVIGYSLYLGKRLLLVPCDHIKKVTIDENKMLISSKYFNDREYLEKWYKRQAKLILTKRLREISDITGIPFEGLRITSARKRWGSCSSKNNINLTWRLILADEKAIDYVIIHELCHVKHKNHSKNYWKLVKNLMPDYKDHRRWLKDNSYILDIF